MDTLTQILKAAQRTDGIQQHFEMQERPNIKIEAKIDQPNLREQPSASSMHPEAKSSMKLANPFNAYGSYYRKQRGGSSNEMVDRYITLPWFGEEEGLTPFTF